MLNNNKDDIVHFTNTLIDTRFLCEYSHIINNKIDQYKNRLDNHYIVLLYYKIACLYFGMGKNKLCIAYLQKIIRSKNIIFCIEFIFFEKTINMFQDLNNLYFYVLINIY